MPSLKNLRISQADRNKASLEWDKYYEKMHMGLLEEREEIDPNIDPTVCILLGQGPSMYYHKNRRKT